MKSIFLFVEMFFFGALNSFNLLASTEADLVQQCEKHLGSCESVFCVPNQAQASENIKSQLPGLIAHAENLELQNQVVLYMNRAVKQLVHCASLELPELQCDWLIEKNRSLVTVLEMISRGQNFLVKQKIRNGGMVELSSIEIEAMLRKTPEEVLRRLEGAREYVLESTALKHKRFRRDRYKNKLLLKIDYLQSILLRLTDVATRAKFLTEFIFETDEEFSIFNKLADIVGTLKAFKIVRLANDDFKVSESSSVQNEGVNQDSTKLFEDETVTWEDSLILKDRFKWQRKIPVRLIFKRNSSVHPYKYALHLKVSQTSYDFDKNSISKTNRSEWKKFKDRHADLYDVKRSSFGLPVEIHFNDVPELVEYLQFLKDRSERVHLY